MGRNILPSLRPDFAEFLERQPFVVVGGRDAGERVWASLCAAGLVSGQAELIRAADTFFIASAHPERGADASRRGGRPGFVEISPGAGTLRFPDYSGNRMFQTLGNIAVDPRVGLLFIDWVHGTSLQLTGRARILWAPDEVSARPGAERLVDVQIDAVHERRRAMPARWSLIEPSRLNPPIGGRAASDGGLGR